jgi:hypothetical protein
MMTQIEELFQQLEAAGWQPMWCDTKIKIYDNAVSCGRPEDIGDILCEEESYPHELLPPNLTFKVPAKGDSMCDAGIESGDILTIESCSHISDDDLVLAYIDGEFLVKAFYEDDDGGKWLVPYNEKYNAIKLNEHQHVYISGKVIEVSKRYPRVRHRDSSRIVHNAKKIDATPRVMSREELKQMIATIAPMVKMGRQWFSVYRPLVQAHQVEKDNYSGFCQLVCEAVPDHCKLPAALEIQRMDVLSFTKPVCLWNELNAPVTGKRFAYYKKIAETALELLVL